jgi:uncharacterized membrane protein YphA (DoxX/SURF4 family)
MNNATRFFLVLLRLAIGWHLLFAGVEKFAPDYRGSEGYLRESCGPLAPFYEWMVGDPVLDRLTVRGGQEAKQRLLTPGPDLGDEEDDSPEEAEALHEHMPLALKDEWEGYYDAFVRHYRLDERQQDLARGKLEQAEDNFVEWATHGIKEVKKTSPYGPPIEKVMSTPQRIQVYKEKVKEIKDYQRGEYAFGMFTPFSADRARDLQARKAELAAMRSDLNKDVEDHSKQMRESLHSVITDEQAERPMPYPVRVGWSYMSRLDWIDFLVRWGLVIAGGCLLLGLFSRSACIGGALLLLSFYLAAMPLPGAAEIVRREGYPYINKNIIEILALLTLATTASGRWAGLDAFLYFLNPWRRRVEQRDVSAPAAPVAPAPVAPAAGPVVVHQERVDLT